MKSILSIISLFLLVSHALGHDEGHGPAVKDESLYGGKVVAIIKASEVEKGRGAKLLYKGELVYESRGEEVKVYIFDSKMKPIEGGDQFSNELKAILMEKGSEKAFTLNLDKSKKFYTGKRPLNKRVPFSIDIRFSRGKDQLFGAFDGLD